MGADKDKLRRRGNLWFCLGFGVLLAVGLLCIYPGEVSYGLVWIFGLLGTWALFFGMGALMYGSYCWVKYKRME